MAAHIFKKRHQACDMPCTHPFPDERPLLPAPRPRREDAHDEGRRRPLQARVGRVELSPGPALADRAERTLHEEDLKVLLRRCGGGRVVGEEGVLVEGLVGPWILAGVRRQAGPLPRGRVGDGREEEEQAVAVARDLRRVGPVVEEGGVEVAEEVRVDGRVVDGGRAGEEHRGKLLADARHVEVEDAGDGERQEVLAEKAAGVHGCAPGLAHAAAGGQAAGV